VNNFKRTQRIADVLSHVLSNDQTTTLLEEEESIKGGMPFEPEDDKDEDVLNGKFFHHNIGTHVVHHLFFQRKWTSTTDWEIYYK